MMSMVEQLHNSVTLKHTRFSVRLHKSAIFTILSDELSHVLGLYVKEMGLCSDGFMLFVLYLCFLCA